MTVKAVMAELRKLGSEQTRRIYANHGVQEPQYGVKHGDLDRIARRIGVDHDLALALWETANHDARTLACKIADPDAFTVAQANAWVRGCNSYPITDAVAATLADSSIAKGRCEQWRDRKGEWAASAGWALVGQLASRDGRLTDAECKLLASQIRREIHDRPNRVRHEMNMALIAIGMRSDQLEKLARSTADAIGELGVDHGRTSCTTPDVGEYLDRVSAHRRRKGR